MECKRELRHSAQAQSFGGESVLLSPFLSIGSLDFPDVPASYLQVDLPGFILKHKRIEYTAELYFLD